jgi:hypothetical protein
MLQKSPMAIADSVNGYRRDVSESRGAALSPGGLKMTLRGDTRFSQTKPLDRWDEKGAQFVLGLIWAKWERVRRQNHWFDSLYNACAAGYFCGARLLGETVKRQPVRRSAIISAGIQLPDARPWLEVDEWRQMNRFG